MNDTLLKYLHNLQDVTPSKASRNAAALWLRKFDAVVRDNPITTKTLMAFRDSLKHYAPASANRGIAVVRAFLKHQRLCGEPLPDSELCAEALKPYKVVTSVPRFLSGSEIAALCNTRAPRPVETFLALGLLTGARPGEILAMQPAHHRPTQGLVVYAPKTRRERIVPLHDSQSLASLLSCGGGGDAAYCDGFKITAWGHLTTAALGRKVPPKILRSTWSSYAASSGKIPERLYAARAGHGIDVAYQFYAAPLQGVTGDTVEEWYGAEACEALLNLVKRICG